MKTTVSAKGLIALPVKFREQDRIQPGDQLEIKRVRAGEYLLKKVSTHRVPDVLDWLLACPEKGWFQPLPSESTDEL